MTEDEENEAFQAASEKIDYAVIHLAASVQALDFVWETVMKQPAADRAKALQAASFVIGEVAMHAEHAEEGIMELIAAVNKEASND